MSRLLAFLALAVLALCGSSALAQAQYQSRIEGRATVIDGDTIEINGQRIRFVWVDAVELAQTCSDAKGAEYPCGERAAAALSRMVADKDVRCERERVAADRDAIIALCRAGDTNLGHTMVNLGWALALSGAPVGYRDIQHLAKFGERGIWAGKFVEPDQWRRGRR